MASPDESTELSELTRDLVAMDTTSCGSNLPAAEMLAERLDDLGARTSLQCWKSSGVSKANIVASFGPPEPSGLILSGHIDTVPFTGQAGWVRDPLSLEITSDRVFGRGTSDMKTFLVQCILAIRTLDQKRMRRPLVVLFTADEETGCRGSLRLAAEIDSLLTKIPRPKLAWIGEPTSWRIFHAHKAIGIFDVTVHGRGGHSGLPGLGVNAITVAGRLIERLRAWQEEQRIAALPSSVFPEIPYATVNLGTIQGGTASNMIADECQFQVSFRSLPDDDPKEVYQSLESAIREVDLRDGISDRKAEVEIGDPDLVPGMLAPRGSSLENVLVDVMKKPCEGGALFATDGCRFTPLGITTLISGPGDFEEAHQPNESISRSAFEEGSPVIARVIQELCFA